MALCHQVLLSIVHGTAFEQISPFSVSCAGQAVDDPVPFLESYPSHVSHYQTITPEIDKLSS